MDYRLIVFDWNPNGTNDIQIEGAYSDGDPRCEPAMSEALFGIDVNKGLKPRFGNSELQEMYGGYYLPIKLALKHIAVSPVSDGLETIEFLSQYFKSVKVRGAK